jgi:tetratricopeptide (TPR) repeat protein
MPSLNLAYARALAAYMLVRGTPGVALKELGRGERPMELVGWGRGEGLRAQAYNALGDHARAKDTCVAALAHMTTEDLEFCALNLGLQIELARAEAGLGNMNEAERQLRALLEKCEPAGNPITVGALYEALAELAALRGDEGIFDASLKQVGHWFRQTRDPALVARHERLARDARWASRSADGSSAEAVNSQAPRMMTVVHRLRHGGDHSLTGSAEWALKQLSELTDCQEAYLFVKDDNGFPCAARMNANGNEGALTKWVGERLAVLEKDADGALETCTTGDATDPTRLCLGPVLYRITVLRAASDSDAPIIGALVLPSTETIPFPVVQTIAERLVSARRESSVAPAP